MTHSHTISVLVGSIRTGRQGIKVANHVANQLKQRGHKVHLIDPLEYPSLLVFQERFRFQKDPKEDLVKVQQMLDESDGFIGVTPEYNYSYSPQIKQTMDIFFNEFKFKPMSIVGYSGGAFAGVRAIEQLKLAATALGCLPVDAYWALPTVQNQFDENGNLKEAYHQGNLDKVLRTFEWYVAALANHRKLDPSIVPKAVKEV